MKKFVIFGLGRSGSHLLGNLLDKLPGVYCEGEIFNRGSNSRVNRTLLAFLHRHPMKYIQCRRYAALIRRPYATYGFMLKLNQIDRFGMYAKPLQYLKTEGWGIIHLQRLSIFDQTVSILVARRSGRWNSSIHDKDADMGRIIIEPAHFLDTYKLKQKQVRQCHALVADLPHLSLTYEYDLQSPEQWQGTVCRVCDFLGINVPPSPVRSSVRKTWRKPYDGLIENHDELLELAREHGEPP